MSTEPVNNMDFAVFAYPDTRSFGISLPKASAMSLLPIFAIHCKARLTWIGLRELRSFFILCMINLIKSLFVLTRTDMKRYPWKEEIQLSEKYLRIRYK